MSAPFVVKTVSRIHPGKAAAYRGLAEEICRLAEEREPRLLAFHIFVNEDESSEVVVSRSTASPTTPSRNGFHM
jgi:hypothetical protein